MKIKGTVLFGVAGLVLTLSPMVSTAQTSGQFAVAQPHAPFLPTRPPAVATRVPFPGLPAGSGPIVIVQPPSAVRNPFFNPGQIFLPNQTVAPTQFLAPTQVFAPTQAFIPNSVFAPTQAVIPNQFVLPAPTQMLVPGQTVIPSTTFQMPTQVFAPNQAFLPMPSATMPSATQAPAAFGSPSPAQAQTTTPLSGMSRADLLQKFGEPTATVTTNSSETLIFRNGTTVTLQNGQVTGSK